MSVLDGIKLQSSAALTPGEKMRGWVGPMAFMDRFDIDIFVNCNWVDTWWQ
jgi:hypothetical protein